jgi:hypothetical protein
MSAVNRKSLIKRFLVLSNDESFEGKPARQRRGKGI